MAQRELKSARKRVQGGDPAVADALDVQRARMSIPADVVLDCTRAALCAGSPTELWSAVCERLLAWGLYSEARYEPSSDVPLRAVVPGADVTAADSGLIALPVAAAGQIRGTLTLRTSDARVADPGERASLQALADDMGRAEARLAEAARLRDLAASERRLRETFEHAGVGITRIDMSGCFREVNQKFCEMLGYRRDELIGRATRDFTVAQDYGPGAVFREKVARGLATVSIAEKRYLRKDGTHVWVRRTMSPAYDEQGAVHEVISVVEDITERKMAAEAVRSERTLLRTIIDAIPHYIYVKDTAGRFTLVNKAWLDGRGLSAEQVRGKTVFELFPADIAGYMATRDRSVLDGGATLLDVEHAIDLGPPGREQSARRWALTTTVPLANPAGEVVGLVGISRDISESKRTAQALRDYVDRFELAARATSDVLWDWDLVADTLWWGDGIEKLVLHRREELAPSIDSWLSRIHPDEAAQVRKGIHLAIADPETSFWSEEYRFRRADGTHADVYDRAYITRDAQGRATRMLGALMDISERKRAERERAMEHVVSRVLSESRSVEETMPLLLRTICEAMGWAYGAW